MEKMESKKINDKVVREHFHLEEEVCIDSDEHAKIHSHRITNEGHIYTKLMPYA